MKKLKEALFYIQEVLPHLPQVCQVDPPLKDPIAHFETAIAKLREVHEVPKAVDTAIRENNQIYLWALLKYLGQRVNEDELKKTLPNLPENAARQMVHIFTSKKPEYALYSDSFLNKALPKKTLEEIKTYVMWQQMLLVACVVITLFLAIGSTFSAFYLHQEILAYTLGGASLAFPLFSYPCISYLKSPRVDL